MTRAAFTRLGLALAGVLLASACSSSASPATTGTSVGAPSSSATSATSGTSGTVAVTTPATSSTTSGSSSSTTSTSATTAAPTTTAAPATTACPAAGGTKAVEVTGPLSRLIGSSIRTGAHGCYERVVINLKDSGSPASAAFPGYRVAYATKPVRLQPADQPVSLAGGAALEVTLQSWMTGLALGVTGYEGPRDLFPKNVTVIKELRLTQDFEGVSTWAIGLDQRRNFTVWTSSNPPRLVIDIQTG